MQTRVDETGDGSAPSRPELSPKTTSSDLPRYEGPRAEIAHWSGVLLDAQAGQEREREREACIRLAHLYTQRGTNLDVAVTLARRALAIEDDAQLRSELAGWLSGLGDPAAAALELRGTVGASDRGRARTLVQAGVLMARARRADSAALVFDEAADVDPQDPIPRELAGTLATWAEDVVPRDQGALAYVAAAERRAALGDEEAALEDLLRGFELCPSSNAVAAAVAGALQRQGRPLAADETLRDHAAALENENRASAVLEVHAQRIASALEGSDTGLALSAALDLGLAAVMPRPELDARIDEVLSLAGLHEVVAARLERRARGAAGAARAAAFDALARVLAAATADDDRALLAWIDAAVADPAQSSALDALRERAESSGDHEPLVEALVRILAKDRADLPAPRSVLARLALELSALAEGPLEDPLLADWAFDRARAFDGAQSDTTSLAHSRLESALAEREAEITRTEVAAYGRDARSGSIAPSAPGPLRDARLDALRRLVKLLGRSPAAEEKAFAALAALCRAEAREVSGARSLRMLYERAPSEVTRSELYESVLRGKLESHLARREQVRVRLELAAIVEGEGSGRRVLDELVLLLDVPELDALGASQVLVAALSAGSTREEARALAALAATAERHTSALLLAASADAYRRAGALTDARRMAERALDLDPACSRAASSLARVAALAGGRDAAIGIERALGLIVPRAWLCDALARSLEEIGESDLAFAWTHRWLALAPSDRRAISELLRRCQLGTDAHRIREALTWVLAQPDPPNERAELLLDALGLLFSLDRTKAGQVARRALDVLGPTALVRDRLGALADEHGDAGLAIAVLERVAAAEPETSKDLLVELAQRRASAGDFDGAAQELLRAANGDYDATAVLDAADDVESAARAAGLQAEERAKSSPPNPKTKRVIPGLGSDGVVALAELRARVLSALLSGQEQQDNEPGQRRAATRPIVSEAWRTLGAMRWDLAHDPRGSELALFSAAETLNDGAAFSLYAKDLCELAGADKAVAALFERLASLEEAPPEERLCLALSAGQLAAEHGLASWALDGSLAALAIEPSNADAISLAESQAPLVDGGEAAIDHIYEALASAAMGMYGRRAAHYRAARQLERLGSRELALKHALKAFEAVPTEGTSWTVLTRLVDPVRGSPEAVEMFANVAARAKNDDKAGWFRRAVELSGSDRPGLERRLDVILRAFAAVADSGLVGLLADAVERLEENGGLSLESRTRIAGVALDLLPGLEGPDGARTAAHFSRLLAESAASARPPSAAEELAAAAFKAIDKAIEIDGEVEVFDRIAPSGSKFAAFPEKAIDLVQRVVERTKTKHALVGPPLLRFASSIADALGDSRVSAELLGEAERRDAPEASGPIVGAAATEDPFADPSFLESNPPPPIEEPAAASKGAEPEPERPAKARPRLELGDSEPPPPPAADPLADNLEAFAADLFAPSEVPPRPGPGAPRRSASGTTRAAPELSPIKDGFDALFDSNDAPIVARSLPPEEPEDPATDAELETLETEARDRGDYEAVSDALRRRIAKSESKDQIRLLKLRRAAVLEQRLSRFEDARTELTELLEADKSDKSALSFLADLYEQRGEPKEAAPLFERLASLTSLEDDERRRFAIAGARAHLAAGDSQQALKVLDQLPQSAHSSDVARERVSLLRACGDMFSLVLAIDQLVADGGLSEEEQATFLIEGSRAAGASGDQQGALIRARRAARLAPTLAEAVLECALLEYRTRGTGTPREAQAVVDTLTAIAPTLAPAEIELHTFLLAEVTDVIHGGGAGLRELSHRHAEVGPLPLIALGMAERLSRSRSFDAAVPLFTHAIAGDLRGLRNTSRVALAATDAAIQAGHLDDARTFVEAAAQAPELAAQVERRKREILAFDDDPAVARPVLQDLAKESTGLMRARLLQRLARMTLEEDFEHAVSLYEEALQLARRDRVLADRIRLEILEILEARGLGKLETIPAPASESEPVSTPAPSVHPDSAHRQALVPGDDAPSSEPPSSGAGVVQVEPEWVEEVKPEPAASAGTLQPPERAMEAAAKKAPPPLPAATPKKTPSLPPPLPAPIEPAKRTPSVPPAQTSAVATSPVPPAAAAPRERERVEPLGPLAPPVRPLFLNSQEEALFDQLLDGYLDAADALVEKYAATQEARARDVVIVRRHQVALKPGVRRTITALREAALVERDEVYARALEHVLAVDGGDTVKPPPLFAQPREPELLSALLFRDISSREVEVLSLAWEAGMFRKELASYGVGGTDRVPLTAASVIGEAYSEIAALLGSPRPVFHKRSEKPGELSVALLPQPALLASGEFKSKSPEVVYRLAATHASAAPELVLAAHLDDATMRKLFEAMMAAFGPVRPRDDDAPMSSASAAQFKAEVARLAGDLWQRINPKAERRLRDLCDLGPLEVDVARATAKKAMRRAGLFASGDLGLALRLLSKEDGQPDLAPTAPGSLEIACEVSDEVTDLVRLATRMEFAEARWQQPSPASVRR